MREKEFLLLFFCLYFCLFVSARGARSRLAPKSVQTTVVADTDQNDLLTDYPFPKCSSDPSELAVELVLVVCGSWWYSGFIESLQKTEMNHIFDSLNSKYPNIKIGIASFTTWSTRTKTASDYCYENNSPLTADKDSLLTAVQKITISGSILAEKKKTSLMALSLAVLDDQMGWTFRGWTSDGRRVVRVAVVITDELALLSGSMPDLPPFTGTTADSCNNDAPNPSLVGRVLSNSGVRFAGLIASPYIGSIDSEWTQYATAMDVPPLLIRLNRGDPEHITDRLTQVVDKVVCLPYTSTTTPSSVVFTEPSYPDNDNSRNKKGSRTTIPSVTTPNGESGVNGPILVGAAVGGIALLTFSCGMGYWHFNQRRALRQTQPALGYGAF